MRSIYRLLVVFAVLASLLAVPLVGRATAPPQARFLPLEWHLTAIHAPQGWAQGATGETRTHRRIKVFVMDTGISPMPALAGSIGPSFTPFVPITLTTPPAYSPDAPIVYKANPLRDAIGHGSFVASEVAGHGPDYTGVCPRCVVGSGKVFDQDPGATDADIITAYYWAVNHHYDIVSMSLGGGSYDPLFQQAVNYGAAHGVLCVAAAGNDGAEGFVWPGSLKGCLRVTASDQNNMVTDWSSFGGDVSVAAPGSNVYGYLPAGRNLIGNRGLSTLSGTSMATPIVAGVLADLESLGLSPVDATSALLFGAHIPKQADATTVQDGEHWGAGLVDLAASVAWARGQHSARSYVPPKAWKQEEPPTQLSDDSATSSLPIPSWVHISAAGPM